MNNNGQFWVQRHLPEDRAAYWRLGRLRLWIRKDHHEWLIAEERGDSELRDCAIVPLDVVPAGLEWTAYALAAPYRDFEIRPVVPDRPVVVRARHPIIIPPRQKDVFYARVPVFANVHAVCPSGESPPVSMRSTPTRLLSDTWFGDTMEGVLCYALFVRATRNLGSLCPGPHHLVCSVHVCNNSDADLQLERLCLRLEHVDIYRGHDHLWSSPIYVEHSKPAEPSVIDYTHGKPLEEKGLRLLHKAKEQPKGLVRRTIGWIASHSSYF